MDTIRDGMSGVNGMPDDFEDYDPIAAFLDEVVSLDEDTSLPVYRWGKMDGKRPIHRIASDLDRAWAGAKLNGAERRLLQYVREHTWGIAEWHKAEVYACRINQSRLAGIWGIGRNRLSESVAALVRDGLLITRDRHYIINKNVDTWAPGRLDPASRRYAIEGDCGRYAAGPLKVRKPIPRALRTAVHERDAYRCLRCGSHVQLAIDHIVPDSLGGETTFDNLQTLCKPCNSWKGIQSLDYRPQTEGGAE